MNTLMKQVFWKSHRHFFVLCLWQCCTAWRILVSGIEPWPQQWKPRTLTTVDHQGTHTGILIFILIRWKRWKATLAVKELGYLNYQFRKTNWFGQVASPPLPQEAIINLSTPQWVWSSSKDWFIQTNTGVPHLHHLQFWEASRAQPISC